MRLEDSEGATACPDDDDLATFAAGRASPALNDAIQAHLAGCGGCFAILAALARDASGTTGGAGEELDATAPGPDPTASLASGAVIDRYLLLECLGAGGMGVVYSAYDRELDRKVALKVLLAGSSAAGAPWLLREAQALAQLAHPNVVAVHDVGTVEGRVWIAMEHVAGDTLRGWSRARRRGWQDVVRVLVDVARGVAAAHDAGLVHRDLKLENVMIGDDGRVRVLDFGLAHGRSLAPLPAEAEDASAGALALRMRLTRTGAIQGTPATMAPEQWEGRDAGPAADQFAWSVMAWELLHGERPSPATTRSPSPARSVPESGGRRPAIDGRRRGCGG
ncbi:MAG: protein kinase [Nannocystaceae bacterium]